MILRIKSKNEEVKSYTEDIKRAVKNIVARLKIQSIKLDINLVDHINTKASGLLEKDVNGIFQIYVKVNGRYLSSVIESLRHELYHLYQLKNDYSMDYEMMISDYNRSKQVIEDEAKRFSKDGRL